MHNFIGFDSSYRCSLEKIREYLEFSLTLKQKKTIVDYVEKNGGIIVSWSDDEISISCAEFCGPFKMYKYTVNIYSDYISCYSEKWENIRPDYVLKLAEALGLEVRDE